MKRTKQFALSPQPTDIPDGQPVLPVGRVARKCASELYVYQKIRGGDTVYGMEEGEPAASLTPEERRVRPGVVFPIRVVQCCVRIRNGLINTVRRGRSSTKILTLKRYVLLCSWAVAVSFQLAHHAMNPYDTR